MKKSLFLCALGLPFLLSGQWETARATVTLPPILSDHMVLQRSDHTAVWGKADPAEKIAITLGDVSAEAVADADGRWKALLNLSAVKEGPFELKIAASNQLTVADVLVGEVWLCSGQSNMAYTLNRALGGKEEIAQSDNTRLRQFSVFPKASPDPLEECRGAWIVASPATSMNFSAVAYFFGKNLQQTVHSPVGLILSAWAGTQAVAWTSKEALEADPELKAIRDRGLQQEAEYPEKKAGFVIAMPAWEAANGRQDRPSDPVAFTGPTVPETDWKKVTLPGNFRDMGLPDSGVVWLRRKITLPAGSAGSVVSIDVGAPHDFDTIYWNGHEIGGMTEATAGGKADTRRYNPPKEFVQDGDNILALRLFTPTDKGGVSTAPFFDLGATRILIANDWLARAESELPALTAQMRQNLPQIPGAPDTRSAGRLYNGMISPLIATSIAGVIWYQGEQDTGRPAALYLKMLKALILDWRARWGSEIPFVICQLPNNGAKTDKVGESRWAEIRSAQLSALELPKTAEPVFIDLGEENVHPPDKKPVGERVALSALAAFYGQKLVASGPLYQSVKADGNKAVVSFGETGGGLVAKPLPADYQPTYLSPERKPLTRHSPGGELEGFALCGDDKKWVWADAKIEGTTVVVTSPSVAKPVAVRYAWADNPTCNLYNTEGLPASPFEATIAP